MGGADVVGIAPRLVHVTATVVVRVDIGHQVDGAGLDAHERRVDRVDVVDVVELRHVGAQLRERLAGEVGRLMDFDDDLAFWRLARAEVADNCAALAVARRQLRVAVFVRDVHLELGPFAPARVRRVVLGVHQRHAPEIVAAVHEDGGAVRRDGVVHIQLRRERAADGTDRSRDTAWQSTDAGVVDDVGRVRRRRNLQAERRHRVVGRRERESRRRAVDRRYKCRRHGRRLDALRVERVYERRQREVRRTAVGQRGDGGYLVLGSLEVNTRDSELLGVLGEPLPVEIELVVREDVGLRQIGAVIQDDRLRDEHALRHRLVADLLLAIQTDTTYEDVGRQAGRSNRRAAAFAARGSLGGQHTAGDALDHRAVARAVGKQITRNYSRGVL